ncbi:MAG: EpsI family protein [Pyrinomonadaceae bacterium]|nr:EpsI family protein [Pyrinomonadaceae bacterium]MCX7639937.1 EpsI family protein [Pyrinomonadaceae bacterium]
MENRFALIFSVLVVGAIIVKWFEWRSDVVVLRRPLQEFPRVLGDWRQIGSDILFDAETENILRASDYIMRDYVDRDGKVVNLYVGYYDSQRTGATYHSPQNCLPGSGWQLKNPNLMKVTMSNGKRFDAKFYVIENSESRELMLYWYQGRGRFLSDEYQDKLYTVFDKIFRRRSDGSIVRITIPSDENDDERSIDKLLAFSVVVAENLSAFVPE